MKKLISLTVALLLASNVTFAEVANSNINQSTIANQAAKIGIIDVQTILQKSPQMEAAAKKLKNEFKPRQEKITALQKSISENQGKLKRDSAVLSASELSKLEDKIGDQQRELRRLEEDYMQDAQIAQQKAMETVLEKINAVVQKIAENGQYDLIIQKNTVAFASNKISITEQVVKGLQEKK